MTDEEEEAIDRCGLNAAYKELQALNDESIPLSKQVLACIKAFKAAREAIFEAVDEIEKAHPGYNASAYRDFTHIVCSAMMGLTLDSVDEIHPLSVSGARLLPLLKAAKALEAMDSLESAFDDDEDVFGVYLAEETAMMAEASILSKTSST